MMDIIINTDRILLLLILINVVSVVARVYFKIINDKLDNDLEFEKKRFIELATKINRNCDN